MYKQPFWVILILIIAAMMLPISTSWAKPRFEEDANLFAIFLPLIDYQHNPSVTATPIPTIDPAATSTATPTLISTVPTATPTAPVTATALQTPTSTATATPSPSPTATQTPLPTVTSTATPVSIATATPTSIPFPDITFSCTQEPSLNNAVLLHLTITTTLPAPSAASFFFEPTELQGPVDNILQPISQLTNIFANQTSAESPGALARCDTAGQCTAIYTLTETEVTRYSGTTVDCNY